MDSEEEEQQLATLAQNLAEMILKGLGARSRWALRTALDAAETEGIVGVCVLNIASKKKDYTDIIFTVGSVDVTQHWSKTA